MYGYIYIITCTVNGKQYVGQTISKLPKNRMNGHLHAARDGDKRPLYAAIRKYGQQMFEFEIIWATEDKASLDISEDSFVQLFETITPNGYNLRGGGSNGKHTPETIAQISQSNRLAHQTDSTRQKHASIWTEEKRKLHGEIIRTALAAPGVHEKVQAALIKGRSTLEAKENHRIGTKIAQNRPEMKENNSRHQLGRKCITDGISIKKIWPADPIPEGWWFGVTRNITEKGRDGLRTASRIWLGRKHTPETCAKMSASAKQRRKK